MAIVVDRHLGRAHEALMDRGVHPGAIRQFPSQRKVAGCLGTVGFLAVNRQDPRGMDGARRAGHRDGVPVDLCRVLVAGELHDLHFLSRGTVSAYEQLVAPVLPLLRPTRAHRHRGGGRVVLAAKNLAQEGDGTFTAREVHAELERLGTPLSWVWVRRMVSRRLAGREGGPEPVLVEVTPGRYRFRTDEPVLSGPVEPAAPPAGPATASAPAGCRAAVLEAAAVLAARDAEGLFHRDQLRLEMKALGFGYTEKTVKKTLSAMTGRPRPGYRSFDDLERVRPGVYRLRPE